MQNEITLKLKFKNYEFRRVKYMGGNPIIYTKKRMDREKSINNPSPINSNRPLDRIPPKRRWNHHNKHTNRWRHHNQKNNAPRQKRKPHRQSICQTRMGRTRLPNHRKTPIHNWVTLYQVTQELLFLLLLVLYYILLLLNYYFYH